MEVRQGPVGAVAPKEKKKTCLMSVFHLFNFLNPDF
jgi:hypothetical protein